MQKIRGFTLIELLVVVAIVGVLSSIILFSITQYINRGKDASIIGNLVILVAAGEVYYDHNNNSYLGFHDSSAFVNSWNAIPDNNKQRGETQNEWAACSQIADTSKAYCVDSRGVKREIDNSGCTENITVCPAS